MQTKNISKGGGCLTIFGSIFLLAGLLVGAMGLKTVYKGFKASDWESVQASILHAELKVSRGDDSTTYQAVGEFQYIWQGQTYQSEQLHFGSGSDNIGSFHQDLIEQMRDHQARRATIQAWVDPKDPSNAVLIKDIRWGMFGFMMIFPVVFGGAGLGIIFLGRRAQKQELKTTGLQAMHPRKPWRWYPEWEQSVLRNDSKAGVVFAGIFTAIFSLVSIPVLYVIPEELDKGNWPVLIALLFPLAAVGMLYWFFVALKRWKRFNDAQFVLETHPVALGHYLRGHLSFSAELPLDTRIKLKLSAIHRYTSGSGDNRKTREDIKWQDEQSLVYSSGDFGQIYSLPIEFRVPRDQAQSHKYDTDLEDLWRLSIISELEGADLDLNFEIPVFDPEQYDIPHAVGLVETSSNGETTTDLYADNASIAVGEWQQTSVIYELRPEGHYYFVPPARHKGMAFPITVMCLLLLGVGSGGFFIEKFPLLLSIIFCLFGLVLLYSSLRLWLHKTEFTINNGRLKVRSGMFLSKSDELGEGDVKEIKMISNMSSGSTKYYSLEAHTYLGAKYTLAAQLLGKRNVASLRQKIMEELGLGRS